jgi:cytochrome b561
MTNSVHSKSLQAVQPQMAYTRTARIIHWLMTILIIGMLALGWYMMAIEDEPGSDWYFNTHKSIGITLILLVVLRLLWRLAHQPGLLPKHLPHWQVTASKVSHYLLYATMFAMPLAGFTGALFSKHGIAFFGQQLPTIVTSNHAMAELFFFIHSVIAWVFVALISLHLLAALKHLFIDKDKVFQRIWIQKK